MNVLWKVVSKVAAEQGVEPAEVDEPLGEVIEPEALAALCSAASEQGTVGSVQFVYSGYQVTVHFDGDVEVSEAISSGGAGASETRLAD